MNLYGLLQLRNVTIRDVSSSHPRFFMRLVGLQFSECPAQELTSLSIGCHDFPQGLALSVCWAGGVFLGIKRKPKQVMEAESYEKYEC